MIYSGTMYPNVPATIVQVCDEAEDAHVESPKSDIFGSKSSERRMLEDYISMWNTASDFFPAL